MGGPLEKMEPPAIDGVLDQFETAWRRGGTPQIEEYLRQANVASGDPSWRRELLIELTTVDLWHRWRRAARGRSAVAGDTDRGAVETQPGRPPLPERPLLEDYASRYGDLGNAADLPLFVIGEEYRARCRFGSRPAHATYFERFRTSSEAIGRLLRQIDAELAGGSAESEVATARPADAQPAVAAETAPEVSSVGKYPVIGVLDQGGQATVYRAVHPTLSKELVIKLGRRAIPPEEIQADLLAAEGRLLAELDHPNLGRVYDLDLDAGRPYLVMEYIRGLNLRQYVEQHRLGPAEIARLLAKIARALAWAHARGVVHQDLKPKNIMIDEAGEPRIIDFGLARLSHAWSETHEEPGNVYGTIQFMSPEQARGENDAVTHRADIFALGAVLYWWLTGSAPFSGKVLSEVLERAGRCDFDAAELEAPGIPGPLRRICLKAMSASPEARYASADEMAAELEHFSARRWWRSRRAVAGALLAAVVALVAGRAWWLHALTRPAPAEPPSAFQRQGFGVRYWVAGQKEENPSRVMLQAGQMLMFRFQPDRDCYVGVWHVDAQGHPTLLFPNRHEQDHFVAAGQERSIPGDKASIVATRSEGPESVYIAASSAFWDPEIGQQHGPQTVSAGPEEQARWKARLRGLVVQKNDAPAVVEIVLPLEVR